MIRQIARRMIWATVFGALVIAAQAGTPFDGEWSVLIITDAGTCDQSYRFAGRIKNGILVYEGGAAINVSGRVAPSGAVTVTVSNGAKSRHGLGTAGRERRHGNLAWPERDWRLLRHMERGTEESVIVSLVVNSMAKPASGWRHT
jgi:hypothetical protein